jgi:hypothetical protein
MIKYKDDNFFNFLNFIFKKSNDLIKDYKPPLFLVNRWITMANPLYCKIVNFTFNKWSTKNNYFDADKFYRTILPKHTSKITYVKKKELKKDTNFDENAATLLECSQREIIFFKETLEELNNTNK